MGGDEGWVILLSLQIYQNSQDGRLRCSNLVSQYLYDSYSSSNARTSFHILHFINLTLFVSKVIFNLVNNYYG